MQAETNETMLSKTKNKLPEGSSIRVDIDQAIETRRRVERAISYLELAVEHISETPVESLEPEYIIKNGFYGQDVEVSSKELDAQYFDEDKTQVRQRVEVVKRESSVEDTVSSTYDKSGCQKSISIESSNGNSLDVDYRLNGSKIYIHQILDRVSDIKITNSNQMLAGGSSHSRCIDAGKLGDKIIDFKHNGNIQKITHGVDDNNTTFLKVTDFCGDNQICQDAFLIYIDETPESNDGYRITQHFKAVFSYKNGQPSWSSYDSGFYVEQDSDFQESGLGD